MPANAQEFLFNFLILGTPFLIIRFLFGSFLPGAIAGIVPLVLWYGIGLGCASLSTRFEPNLAFYIYAGLSVFLFGMTLFSLNYFGLSWGQTLIALGLNGYTWLCAFYYGGLAFTHKFD